MALGATRLRLLWGAFDFETESAKFPAYTTTQYATLGDSAASGVGVGVRRATLVLTRSGATIADDACQMHFDFLNFTGGDPDDTWTSADYTTLETALTTWWATVRLNVASDTAFSRILWNRVGPGVPKPNAAERILDITTPSSGTGTRAAAPQASFAISLRHPIRRAWGRTYLPMGHTAESNGRALAADVDRCVSATVALAAAAKAGDFGLVVLSVVHSSALLVESVVCDDTIDIVRRRRWKHTNYKKTTAVA